MSEIRVLRAQSACKTLISRFYPFLQRRPSSGVRRGRLGFDDLLSKRDGFSQI